MENVPPTKISLNKDIVEQVDNERKAVPDELTDSSHIRLI